jgi:Endodeoxyribonuclease RusA
MQQDYSLTLTGLSAKRELWVSHTRPILEAQLRLLGRHSTDKYRYEVAFEIVEGFRRPALDLDNYAKKTIDAITKSRLLWKDDEQIDTLILRRKRDKRQPQSTVEIHINRVRGQHSGLPTFFRARCREAANGQITYADVGRCLGGALWHEQPYGLDDPEWAERIDLLSNLLSREDQEGAWNWFREHLPNHIGLVPPRRKSQFLRGVICAFDNGEVDAH